MANLLYYVEVSNSYPVREGCLAGLTPKAKWALLALTIGVIASVVIFGLGLSGRLPAGWALLGGGSALISVAGVLWNAVSGYQRHKRIEARKQKIEELRGLRNYCEVGLRALAFAWELADENAYTPRPFFDNRRSVDLVHQPLNRDLLLLNHQRVIHFDELKQQLQLHPVNPWSKESVVQAADAYMRICYALGSLAFEELDAFVEEQKDGRTAVTAFTDTDTFFYFCFRECVFAYHYIRGGIEWAGERLSYPREIPASHAERFYQEWMIQNDWLELYNDFCDRVARNLDIEELQEKDYRFAMWAQKDEGAETFAHTPDTFPT